MKLNNCLPRRNLLGLAMLGSPLLFLGQKKGLGQTKAPAKSPYPKPATDFTLTDSTGKAQKLSDYKGKVVLLNFWATWCGPCKIEIPWFNEFQDKYKARGFSALGVAMDDEGWELVRPHLAKNKISYPVMVGNEALAEKYGGVDSLPTTFLIDRQGRVTSMHVGLVSKKDYSDEIEKLLLQAGPGVSAKQPAASPAGRK